MSKKKKNVVYSTNPNYNYEFESDHEDETLDPSDQDLRVFIDRKNRKGKSVTIVSGFVGSRDDLKDLGKLLKTSCGVGGSEKNGEIVIQGEFKEKIHQILIKEGYKAKMSGG